MTGWQRSTRLFLRFVSHCPERTVFGTLYAHTSAANWQIIRLLYAVISSISSAAREINATLVRTVCELFERFDRCTFQRKSYVFSQFNRAFSINRVWDCEWLRSSSLHYASLNQLNQLQISDRSDSLRSDICSWFNWLQNKMIADENFHRSIIIHACCRRWNQTVYSTNCWGIQTKTDIIAPVIAGVALRLWNHFNDFETIKLSTIGSNSSNAKNAPISCRPRGAAASFVA